MRSITHSDYDEVDLQDEMKQKRLTKSYNDIMLANKIVFGINSLLLLAFFVMLKVPMHVYLTIILS